VEDGSFLLFVVPLEGTQWQMFRGPREDVGRAYVLIFSTLYTWTAAF
jgi:hypothetical protein